MKNRKRSAMIAAATVAAGIALMIGTPASASVWPNNGGQVNCPSFMVARLSFKSPVHTVVAWETIYGGVIKYANVNASSKSIFVYAPRSGPVRYDILTVVSDLNATCVV